MVCIPLGLGFMLGYLKYLIVGKSTEFAGLYIYKIAYSAILLYRYKQIIMEWTISFQ